MTNFLEELGQNAGKVWVVLHQHGPLSETKLLSRTMLDTPQFHAAVGWLARENKICKNGTVYKLGDTNLTPKIGANAGKMWTILSTKKEVDFSSVARYAKMRQPDAYSALGWLARENKIETKFLTTPKEHKVKVKLKPYY